VNVGAVDKSTGKKQSVTVRTSGGLSDADIERMVQEAETMRDADQKKKEGVTVRNDSETLCYQVEKQLSDLKEKMTTADADELKKKMEEVRGMLGGEIEDPDAVKAATKDLQDLSWKVTQQVYQNSKSEGGDEGGADQSKQESKFDEEKKDEKKEEKK